jgi:hypothetical protein
MSRKKPNDDDDDNNNNNNNDEPVEFRTLRALLRETKELAQRAGRMDAHDFVIGEIDGRMDAHEFVIGEIVKPAQDTAACIPSSPRGRLGSTTGIMRPTQEISARKGQ